MNGVRGTKLTGRQADWRVQKPDISLDRTISSHWIRNCTLYDYILICVTHSERMRKGHTQTIDLWN